MVLRILMFIGKNLWNDNIYDHNVDYHHLLCILLLNIICCSAKCYRSTDYDQDGFIELYWNALFLIGIQSNKIIPVSKETFYLCSTISWLAVFLVSVRNGVFSSLFSTVRKMIFEGGMKGLMKPSFYCQLISKLY